MALARTIAGRAGWVGLDSLWSCLVSLVSLFGIAGLIGASEFGLGALALGIVGIVQVVPRALFPDAIIQTPEMTKRRFDAAWTATLLLSILAVLICIALAAPLAAFFREPRFSAVFLSFAIAMIPDAAVAPLTAERRRELDFRMAAIRRMAARGVGAACGVGCALAGLGVWSMVVQEFAFGVLSLMIMLIYSPTKPGFSLAFGDLKPMVRFSSFIIMTQFLTTLGPRLILMYIGRVGDLTLAGYWSLATRLVEVLWRILSHALYQLALPHFARLQEQRSFLGHVVRDANIWLATIVFPGLVLIAVIGPDIIEFLLGDAWLPAAPAVQVLAVGVIIRLRRFMDHVALNALGSSEVTLWAHLLETTVILSALFLLSPKTLFWIACLKALQPLIGYWIIGVRSVQMTERSVAREWLDLFLDVVHLAVIWVVLWYLHRLLVDESLVILLVASPVLAMATAALMMMVLRPAMALHAWSMMRALYWPRQA